MTDTAAPASTTMHDLTLPPLRRPVGPPVGLEDRLDLLELEARFNYCIDSRDYDGLRDLATEDVVMLHPWGDAHGVDAFIQLIRDHHPDEDGVRHQHVNQVIVPGDGPRSARVISYLIAVKVRDPAPQLVAPHLVTHALFVMDALKQDHWRIGRLVVDQASVPTTAIPPEAVDFWGSARH